MSTLTRPKIVFLYTKPPFPILKSEPSTRSILTVAQDKNAQNKQIKYTRSK